VKGMEEKTFWGLIVAVIVLCCVVVGTYCYVDATNPIFNFDGTGRLVAIDTDLWGTSVTLQQTVTSNYEYNLGKHSGIVFDYSMIGQYVHVHYEHNGHSYIEIVQEYKQI
jgi:hypothetical protein